MFPNLLVRRVCSPQRIVAHRRQRMLHFLVFGRFKDEVFWEQRAGQQIDLSNGQIEILGRAHKVSSIHLLCRAFAACQSHQIRVRNIKLAGKLRQRFVVRGSLLPEFRHQRAGGLFFAGRRGVMNVSFSRNPCLFGNNRWLGSFFLLWTCTFFGTGASHEHTF